MFSKKFVSCCWAVNMGLWSIVIYKNIISGAPSWIETIAAVVMIVACLGVIAGNTSED